MRIAFDRKDAVCGASALNSNNGRSTNTTNRERGKGDEIGPLNTYNATACSSEIERNRLCRRRSGLTWTTVAMGFPPPPVESSPWPKSLFAGEPPPPCPVVRVPFGKSSFIAHKYEASASPLREAFRRQPPAAPSASQTATNSCVSLLSKTSSIPSTYVCLQKKKKIARMPPPNSHAPIRQKSAPIAKARGLALVHFLSVYVVSGKFHDSRSPHSFPPNFFA